MADKQSTASTRSRAEHSAQTLAYPGHENEMIEQPRDEMADYVGAPPG